MRIARFTTGDDPKFGVVTDDVIVELQGDPLYVGLHIAQAEHRLEDVRLLSPVIPRSKVIGIGKNYADHAAEMGSEAPSEPLMFLKPNTTVVGPGDPVFLPRISDEVHFEGELAVVVGRICREVAAEQAAEVIFGYTIANDVTARDLQRRDGQFTRAKGFDSFCPLGPWVETEFDPSEARIQTWLNDDLKQDGTTADMIHDVPALIEAVSAVMTLLPGDVILTGTPAGVGQMVAGDNVRVAVEGIGELSNRVVERD